jgi:D-alanyl-D-alanine carboxypeptidase
VLTQKKIHHVDGILGVFTSQKSYVRGMMRTVICACIAWIIGGATWAGPSYVAAILDGESLALLHGFQPRKAVSPASLTKLMTLYLLFDALEKKRVSMDTVWRTSLNASNQPMTHWGLCAGQTVTVRQCIVGIAVRSCNDMAVVVAENLAGSVGNFAQLMNRTAKAMGMKNTFFVNPSGLYDTRHERARLYRTPYCIVTAHCGQ